MRGGKEKSPADAEEKNDSGVKLNPRERSSSSGSKSLQSVLIFVKKHCCNALSSMDTSTFFIIHDIVHVMSMYTMYSEKIY